MNKKILVLGGGYLQSDFIEDALKLGLDVTCIDRDPSCYINRKYPEIFVNIDFGNLLALKLFLRENNFKAAFSPANELGNLLIARVSKEFNFFYNSVFSVENTLDKFKLKEVLKESNIKFPKTRILKTIDNADLDYPFIIKPSNSSASRGVSLVKHEDELKRAFYNAQSFIKEDGVVLIEEYVNGIQYSIETVSFNTNHYIAGITREYTSGIPYFIERSDYTSSEIYYKKDDLKLFIKDLLDTLGIIVGPCHIEVILKNNDVYLIDFATRSGGWRSKLLNYAGGSNYNKLIIDSYFRNEIDLDDIKPPQKTATVGILNYPNDLFQYLKAKKAGDLQEDYFHNKGPVCEPINLIDSFGCFYASYEGNEIKYNLL